MEKAIDGFNMNLWEKHGMRRIYVSGNGIPSYAKFYFDLDKDEWEKAPRYRKAINGDGRDLIAKFLNDEAKEQVENCPVPAKNQESATGAEIEVPAEALREMGRSAIAWEQAEVRTAIRNEWNDGDGDEEWEA